MRFVLGCCVVMLGSWLLAADPAKPVEPLAGTELLDGTDDIASRLVSGVDKFLLGELEKSIGQRAKHWKRDTATPEKYTASVEPNRQRLAHILGVRDARTPFDGLELVGTTSRPPLVGTGDGFKVYEVRWPTIGGITGEGLLLVPDGNKAADVVVIPDADQTPETLAGLADGLPSESQVARRLAESGCRVVVPSLISRQMEKRKPRDETNGRANLTHREFLYRSAFELGRHLIGYELQKVFAVVDWFAKDAGSADPAIGVFGYGEGGMLALYAAALDTRIDAVCVSGHFTSRQNLWNEPLDRNVFGLLEQFGDAELATLVAPRAVIIEAARGPEVTLPSQGGGPAQLVSPSLDEVQKEAARARALTENFNVAWLQLKPSGADGQGSFGVAGAGPLLAALGKADGLRPVGAAPKSSRTVDAAARMARQVAEIDRHNQELLVESPYVRKKFLSKLDTSSLEKYAQTVEPYRQQFRHEVIGHFDLPRLSPHVRSRKSYDKPLWTGYEVVMDVFPDVIAYGILILPKDLKEGEKRPVVVCQHGLEGRPQDIVTGDHPAYHDFASKLAERGFITFSPQNLYIFKDRFRTLQRKANPLKKTLFSVIVPQHQQIVDWLKTLPNVDGQRIGFYGLSYGGKSAMRIPALVTDYSLSICSADFNEWVWKNASSRAPHSYVWTGEYEIFEFDLGSTFNYAEMAALIAPRPFMVERGHFDGVAPDETVGYEFAKVRNLYAARLNLADRTEIEWFVGPHTIHGVRTYEFLHKHLAWPKK